MKKVLFLTSGIYPRDNGRAVGSYGYCKEFGKYCDMHIFSNLFSGCSEEDAYNSVDADVNIQFYSESTSRIKRVGAHPLQYLLFKFIGVLELVNNTMLEAIVQYIKVHDVDMIILDHLAMANYFYKLKKIFPDITYVYNSHNVECINIYQALTRKEYRIDRKEQVFDSKIQRLKYNIFEKIERKILEKTDFTICLSRNDLNLLVDRFGLDPDKAIWTKPMARFQCLRGIEDVRKFDYKLLCVGTMGWYPNARSIVWFIENVFQHLVEREPRYQLYVVGRDPGPELFELEKKYKGKVIVTGAVPSMDPYFKMCDISIVPAVDGTGIKTKILESIGNGILTLCSGYSAKDYDITNQEVGIANTPEEYIKWIQDVAASEELRVGYYTKMREYYDNFYILSNDMKKLFGID